MLLLAMIQGRSDVMAQLSPKTECGKTSVSLPGQGSYGVFRASYSFIVWLR